MDEHSKFKALVHYVCWKCADDPTQLGAVKLNKALWLSDLAAYYQLGRPITGSRYVKRQFGPVPAAIMPVLRELHAEGSVTARQVRHFKNWKTEYSVHREPPAGFLGNDEKQIVDQWVEYVCNEHTAKSISEASHDHIWKAADIGETIPHFTVFAQPGEITDDEREWAKLELEEMAQ